MPEDFILQTTTQIERGGFYVRFAPVGGGGFEVPVIGVRHRSTTESFAPLENSGKSIVLGQAINVPLDTRYDLVRRGWWCGPTYFNYVVRVEDSHNEADSATYTIMVDGGECSPSTPSIIITPLTLIVPEGGTGLFSVRLSNQPFGIINININRAEGGDMDLQVEPSELIFDADNWNEPQEVVISAQEDADAEDGTATFIVSGLGVEDPSTGTREELERVYVLAAESDKDVVVEVSGSDPAMGTVSGSGVVERGKPIEIFANPLEGHVFLEWTLVSGSGDFNNPGAALTSFSPLENSSIRAEFAVCPMLAAPGEVTFSNATTNSVTISWSTVEGAVLYQLETSYGGVVGSLMVAETSHTLTNLPQGVTLNVSVRGIGECGQQGGGASGNFIVPCELGSVTLNVVSDVGQTGARLNWNPVNHANYYHYRISTTVSGLGTAVIEEWPHSVYSTYVGLLSPNTTYYYEVRGASTCGTGPWTRGTFTTLPCSLNAPFLSSPSNINQTGAQINWNAVASATSYLYKISTTVSGLSEAEENLADSLTTQVLSGLLPRTTYYYEVRAVAGCGTSNWVRGDFTTLPELSNCSNCPVMFSDDPATVEYYGYASDPDWCDCIRAPATCNSTLVETSEGGKLGYYCIPGVVEDVQCLSQHNGCIYPMREGCPPFYNPCPSSCGMNGNYVAAKTFVNPYPHPVPVRITGEVDDDAILELRGMRRWLRSGMAGQGSCSAGGIYYAFIAEANETFTITAYDTVGVCGAVDICVTFGDGGVEDCPATGYWGEINECYLRVVNSDEYCCQVAWDSYCEWEYDRCTDEPEPPLPPPYDEPPSEDLSCCRDSGYSDLPPPDCYNYGGAPGCFTADYVTLPCRQYDSLGRCVDTCEGVTCPTGYCTNARSLTAPCGQWVYEPWGWCDPLFWRINRGSCCFYQPYPEFELPWWEMVSNGFPCPAQEPPLPPPVCD
jgi:hypothetical protein